jgi:hypothetical protein
MKNPFRVRFGQNVGRITARTDRHYGLIRARFGLNSGQNTGHTLIFKRAQFVVPNWGPIMVTESGQPTTRSSVISGGVLELVCIFCWQSLMPSHAWMRPLAIFFALSLQSSICPIRHSIFSFS